MQTIRMRRNHAYDTSKMTELTERHSWWVNELYIAETIMPATHCYKSCIVWYMQAIRWNTIYIHANFNSDGFSQLIYFFLPPIQTRVNPIIRADHACCHIYHARTCMRHSCTTDVVMRDLVHAVCSWGNQLSPHSYIAPEAAGMIMALLIK